MVRTRGQRREKPSRGRREESGSSSAKLFRPFLRDEFEARHRRGSSRGRARPQPLTGVRRHLLERDRDQPAGSPDVLLQDYVVGLGGIDVTPPLIERVLDDVQRRERSVAPVFIQEAAT